MPERPTRHELATRQLQHLRSSTLLAWTLRDASAIKSREPRGSRAPGEENKWRRQTSVTQSLTPIRGAVTLLTWLLDWPQSPRGKLISILLLRTRITTTPTAPSGREYYARAEDRASGDGVAPDIWSNTRPRVDARRRSCLLPIDDATAHIVASA